MDRAQSEMESRLDDVLSRIAKETQEIKELEQELTDGQILANEALKKELEGVICGLQQYLMSLRDQGRSDDSETWSELTEIQSHTHQPRTTARTKNKSNPQPGTRLRGRASTDEAAAIRLTGVRPGLTQDSGLDLYVLSSPQGAPLTRAVGKGLLCPTMECHHREHHTDTGSNNSTSLHHCSTEASPPEGAYRQDKKKHLRSETKKLQHTLRRHRNVLGVCEEVWCVEQTLMKRRAELREAQRLLQGAHSLATQARHEAAEWQRKAKESATCVQQMQQQLRELQAKVEALKTSKPDQNQDYSDLTQSPGLDVYCQTHRNSLRNQEEQLQQTIQDLRDQEARARSSLQVTQLKQY